MQSRGSIEKRGALAAAAAGATPAAAAEVSCDSATVRRAPVFV